MVLRAKMVAQSLTVDWLSKAPWVSISKTATCKGTSVRTDGTFRKARPETRLARFGELRHSSPKESRVQRTRWLTRATGTATEKGCLELDPSTHLLPAGLLHNEHLAPDLDAGGLRVGAAPPGKARQGLVVFSQPMGVASFFLQGDRKIV